MTAREIKIATGVLALFDGYGVTDEGEQERYFSRETGRIYRRHLHRGLVSVFGLPDLRRWLLRRAPGVSLPSMEVHSE